MRVSILSSRDTDPNVVFTLSFNVTFGPPSRLWCYYNNPSNVFFNARDDPNLSREVIRSQYTSSQQDMTRVTVKVEQPIKEGRLYRCVVVVEGRRNIVSGTYQLFKMGPPSLVSSSTVTITGECLTLLLNQCYICSSSSSQLQAPPLMSLPAGPATPLSWSPGLLHHHHHQLAMRCSIKHHQLGSVADSVEGTLGTLS